MVFISPSPYFVLWVLILLSLGQYVFHVKARTPLAVKEALKKAKEDSLTTSTTAEYVPPELDGSTEKDEDTYEDEDVEDVREKMKAFNVDGAEMPSPTVAPTSSFNVMNSSKL